MDNNNKVFVWHCKCDCGNEIDVKGDCLRRGITKSCGCINYSIGEKNIENILKKHNCIFKKEYVVSELNNARFDFAIFDKNNNIVRLIEFDGEQHYNEKRGTWKNHESLEITVIAENLLSNQRMGFLVLVNDKYVTTNIEYRTNTDKVNNKQLFCEYKGGVWQSTLHNYDYDATKFETVKGLVGKLTETGKAEKITIRQSTVVDYQVYDGRMRVYIR